MKRCRTFCLFTSVLLLTTPVVHAAPTTAATGSSTASSAPASGSKTTAADFSTPLETARTYLRALFSNDGATLRRSLLVPPSHKEEVDALLALTAAQHQLQIAASDRYKAAGDKAFNTPNAAGLAAQLKTVADATLTVHADVATLTFLPADAGDTEKVPGQFSFKKEGDEWKIDAVTFFSLESPKTPARVALARKLTAVTNDAVKDLIAGKLGSAIEAYQEYQRRLVAASKESAATAASQTAPAPATGSR